VFVATAIALLVEGVGGFVGASPTPGMLEIGAAGRRRGQQGSVPLLLLWWRVPSSTESSTASSTPAWSGVGFAFTENILYLASAYDGSGDLGPGGVHALTGPSSCAAWSAPFAHPLFTACTGVGVGIAVNSRSRTTRIVAPVVGYGCAVLAHAVWNTATVFGPGNFVTIYLILLAPAFLAAVALAVWVRHSEGRMLAGALADAAQRGLLPATDIAWVVDLAAAPSQPAPTHATPAA
jgi:hypothetical protein